MYDIKVIYIDPPGNAKNDYDIFCELSVLITKDIMPGVVYLLQGVWPCLDENGMDRVGTTNILTSTKPTESCKGSRTHSVRVEVELNKD